MAALTESLPEHIGPIDPNQEPAFADLPFSVPNVKDINWDEVIISYDRLSDILILFVSDRYQPAIVVYDHEGDGLIPCLVNPDTMAFVGWQLESFLMTAVKRNPNLITLLDHAELLGLTAHELRRERQRALGYGARARHWVTEEIATARQSRSSPKGIVLQQLFAGDKSPLRSVA